MCLYLVKKTYVKVYKKSIDRKRALCYYCHMNMFKFLLISNVLVLNSFANDGNMTPDHPITRPGTPSTQPTAARRVYAASHNFVPSRPVERNLMDDFDADSNDNSNSNSQDDVPSISIERNLMAEFDAAFNLPLPAGADGPATLDELSNEFSNEDDGAAVADPSNAFNNASYVHLNGPTTGFSTPPAVSIAFPPAISQVTHFSSPAESFCSHRNSPAQLLNFHIQDQVTPNNMPLAAGNLSFISSIPSDFPSLEASFSFGD